MNLHEQPSLTETLVTQVQRRCFILIFGAGVPLLILLFALTGAFAVVVSTDFIWMLLFLGTLATMCSWLLSQSLKSKVRQHNTHLHRIEENLPLLLSKRYEQVADNIASVDQKHVSAEIANIYHQLAKLAGTLENIDVQVAKRVRQSYTQSDGYRVELENVRRLISNAQMLIMTVDHHFDVQFFNDYAQQVTGVSADTILNQGAGNLFSSTYWHDTEHYYKELLAGHIKMANQEVEIIDAQGKIRHVWWLHSLLDDKDGKQILSVGHDVTQEKGVEQRVVWLATHDALTGVLNAAKFEETLSDSLNLADRYDKRHTLLYLHFDFPMYQKLDDHLTQQMTDDMRVAIAETLQAVTRQTDTLARLNEHDFAIIQPESTEEGRQLFAEKLLNRIDELKLATPKKRIPVRLHIGMIDYPYERADVSELFAFAELAAVRAKHQDSKVSSSFLFEPSKQTAEELKQRVFWKKRIQSALEENQFVVHYQPIIALSNRQIVGYEGLSRLLDKDTGEAVPAAKFIEIAEKQGLVEQIDQRVLKQVFAKIAALKGQGSKLFAINLSRQSLEPNTLLPVLKKLLTHFDIAGRQIILEVHEDEALARTESLKLLMTAVKPLGIRFAIDDFGFDGTVSKYGFSSFALLQDLPIDFIKINGHFIRELHQNTHDQLFVKSLVDEAQLHGIKSIAECVENEEVMALLQGYGVDYAQGFFIGHPSAELQDH